MSCDWLISLRVKCETLDVILVPLNVICSSYREASVSIKLLCEMRIIGVNYSRFQLDFEKSLRMFVCKFRMFVAKFQCLF